MFELKVRVLPVLSYEIFVDHGETPNRCTVLPLAYRSDFTLLKKRFLAPLAADILLHPDGLPLNEFDQERGRVTRLAAIDCVWKRLDPLVRSLPGEIPLRARIPEGFVTAYPRVAKHNADPSGGFATIEAIFLAAAFLGEWDLSLLREYYFGEEFLRRNREAFVHYKIECDFELPVYRPLLPRNSHTRRLSRGRRPAPEFSLRT
jgi:ribosome biogenesis protein Tsr3